MTKRDRDRDRERDRDRDRRDNQPEQEQGHRSGEGDTQEGESLTALKGILGKVASLLMPLQLSQEESIRLVEQMYGSVLDMDVKLAGESDETRKTQVLSHIQNVIVRREGDRLVVEYPPAQTEATSKPDLAGREPQPPARTSPDGDPGLDSPAEAVSRPVPVARPRPEARPSPAARSSREPQHSETGETAPAATPASQSVTELPPASDERPDAHAGRDFAPQPDPGPREDTVVREDTPQKSEPVS